MSTPINTLPLKTQQPNMSDTSDINDPIVQDVLNEFQEELMMSKHSKSQQSPISQMPPLPMYQQPTQQQQTHQQQPPINYNYKNTTKYDNITSYIDTDVAKKSLILVIISLIIYHSGIVNTIYEKMPDYLQDNLNNFDIYIKSLSLFSIIYILSFFDYI
jgi:hypothetical protein